jgi:hypothetical protein
MTENEKTIELGSVFVCGEKMNPQGPQSSPLFRNTDMGYILSLQSEPWNHRILTHATLTPKYAIGTVHELYDEKNGRFLGIYDVVGFIRFFTMETRGFVPAKKIPHYRDRSGYDHVSFSL